MSPKSKKILITSETRETVVVRQKVETSVPVYCPQCECAVDMLSFEAAASFAEIRMRDLFDRLKGGVLHHHETADGRLFVCCESLNLQMKGPPINHENTNGDRQN